MLSLLRAAKRAVHARQLRHPAPPVAVGASFAWPQGAAGAVSLSYDDGLANHVEVVAPGLEAAGLRGTFYPHIMSEDFQKNPPAWRAVAAHGHELGNHTCFHPCRAQPGSPRDFDLTNYTERRWCAEIELANWSLAQLDGQSERTFGNTCWDNWLGPEDAPICLEQLVPKYFPAARGERKDAAVNPREFNPFNLGTRCADGATFAQVRAVIEAAMRDGHWLILTLHGVGKGSHSLFMEGDEHRALTDWLAQNRARIWTAPVRDVARQLLNHVA
jgi:peptidoglycan/xylan/chitin deacetylase (PgdA/CDA1 family)